jgi:hypothetical protein
VNLYHLADKKPEAKDYTAQKPELVTHLKKLHVAWAKDVFAK